MNEVSNDSPDQPHLPKGANETLILPKGSSVLESARAEAETSGVSLPVKQESKWGERFQLALLTFSFGWLFWLPVIIVTFSLWGGGNPARPMAVICIVSLLAAVFTGMRFFVTDNRSLWLSAGFYASLLSGTLSVIVLIIQTTTLTGFAGIYALNYSLLALILGSVLCAVLRISHRVFTQLQSRLGEWLVILFTTGLIMAALMPLLQDLPIEKRQKVAANIIAMVLTVAMLVSGSTWSWSIAKQLGETDTRRRLLLMLKGWMLIVGFVALLTLIIVAVVVVIEGLRHFNRNAGIRWTFIVSLLLSPAMLPGLRVHYRVKRSAAAKQQT